MKCPQICQTNRNRLLKTSQNSYPKSSYSYRFNSEEPYP